MENRRGVLRSSAAVALALAMNAGGTAMADPVPAAATAALPGPDQPNQPDQRHAALRANWLRQLTGDATLDRADPAVAAQLQARARAATGWLASMHTAPQGDRLWDDLAGFADTKGLLASAAVTANAARLQQMALAYATPGAPTYRDAALGRATLAGLDWLLRHHYHPGKAAIGNWWDWQIGTPLRLLDTLTLLYGEAPPALRARTLAAVRWYAPDPRYRTRADGTLDRHNAETGANLLDKALAAILAGMLDGDTARIVQGRDAIAPALDYVDHGDGFYRDGSFIQHGYVPYTGSYGAVALADFARLVHLLSGSGWPLADADVARIIGWARDSYVPWFIDGGMPDALRGRKISTPAQTEHSVGRSMLASLAVLASAASAASAADAQALRAAIKGAMARDRSFAHGYLATPGGTGTSGLSLYELGLLKAIAADTTLAAAPEPPGARLYAAMDRAILRGAGFAAVLSMTSPRTSSFEAGNGENLQAWWTGMGMLALYTADQTQFGGDFWPTVDRRRLPGTTTDGSGAGRPVDWRQYPNTAHWVGGATLERHAALGMDFGLRAVTGSSLTGKKSWFLLGDRIVALGAGIDRGEDTGDTGNTGAAVVTVVENRKLGNLAASFTVDGAPLANGRQAGARWAWLDDDQAGTRIGYLFPHGADIVAERAVRTGNWRALNDQQSADDVRATFQALTIAHGGTAGTASSYAYVLLPGASAADTERAARDPAIRIDANDALRAAVTDLQDPQGEAYLANLWQAGTAPRAGQPWVTTTGPAAVVLVERDGRLLLSVADPTQRQQALEVMVARPVAATLSAAAGVTVLATAPQLRLRIDTAGAAGRTFLAEFSLPR